MGLYQQENGLSNNVEGKIPIWKSLHGSYQMECSCGLGLVPHVYKFTKQWC